MSLLTFLGFIIGAVIPWPRSASPFTTSSTGMPQGTPPVDFTPMTQAQLLAQFSDAIGSNGINPRSMRNFVGSTVTTTPGGVPATVPLPLPGWTTATRPTGMVGPAIGYNYTLQQIDMWDDHLGQWVNPSFQGGTVAGATTFSGAVTFASTIGVTGQATFSDGMLVPNMPTVCSAHGQLVNNGQTVGICP